MRENINAIAHEPDMDTEVLARSPKTGRPSVIRHICKWEYPDGSLCGRLISNWKHV